MRKRLFIQWMLVFILAGYALQTIFAVPESPAAGESQRYFVFSPDGQYLAKVSHSADSTAVTIHETGHMKVLTQWSIPSFKAHTIRFSRTDPVRLMLADSERLLVYHLIDDKQKLMFFQPRVEGQEIVQAYFDSDSGEIVWATKSVVYKADSKEKSQKEVGRIPWEDGQIKSVAKAGRNRVAVALEDNKNIRLLSTEKGGETENLAGHTHPVTGLSSQGDNRLISLDSDYQLIIWNVAKGEPEKKVSLKKPEENAQLLGFSMDDSKDKLQVLSQVGQKTVGQSYRIKDLKEGRVVPEALSMSMTDAGNVYSSAKQFKVPLAPKIQAPEPAVNEQPPPEKKAEEENTLYKLAAIEFENENYQAALDLIKQIPLSDPEYGKSRELKREVFEAINAQNIITAASEQISKGNYKSAQIILEKELMKDPDNQRIARQLEKIENKMDSRSILQLLLLLLLLLLIALLAVALWFYFFHNSKGSSKPKKIAGKLFGFRGMKRPGPDEYRELRRQFVYKLDETRRQLNKAAAKDTDRRYKGTWMEMTARLNTIEKRAKATDKYLADFLLELEELQTTIQGLSNQNEKRSGFDFNKEENTQQQQQDKKRSGHSNQKKKTVDQQKTPDYHSILGVKKGASLDEIKQAYRKKMKDYHPDRHTSSEFTWVKEEADKRTREVQEAYIRLSEQFK